jgi:hypothetical protein
MNPGETPLAVTKDMNGQVDAITASTITSRAFLNAVNAAYQAYKGGEVDTNRLLHRKVKQLLMTLITKKGGDSYE